MPWRNSGAVPRENKTISNAICYDCREQRRLAALESRRRRLAVEHVAGTEMLWQTFRNGILPRGPVYISLIRCSFSLSLLASLHSPLVTCLLTKNTAASLVCFARIQSPLLEKRNEFLLSRLYTHARMCPYTEERKTEREKGKGERIFERALISRLRATLLDSRKSSTLHELYKLLEYRTMLLSRFLSLFSDLPHDFRFALEK